MKYKILEYTKMVYSFLYKIYKNANNVLEGRYIMKISWIRSKDDNESFKTLKNLGFDVINMEEPENTDKKIEELIQNDYKIIILSNEIASFSSDIITKYRNQDDVSIVIGNTNSPRDW